MPGAPITLTEFGGLNRAQDARKATSAFVIDGKNFLFDLNGPYSAFATDLISEAVLVNPENAQTFRLDTDIIITTTGVFLQYDDTSQTYYSIFQFEDDDEYFPWTMAQVGVDYFFAKKGVDGVIRYRTTTGYWSIHDNASQATIPTNIYAVTQSFGRLIIIAEGIVKWSAIDDGLDLTVSASTGAGFQSLAILGQGAPLGVVETDAGFMAFTRSGILAMEAVTSYPVFKLKRIRTQEVPINPYAFVNVEQGTVVYAAKNGLKITNGGPPQPWQPLMSEYLVKEIFPNTDLSVNAVVKLSFNQDRQWFAISLANTANPQLYTEALIFYPPSDKWGVFSEQHYGFGELDLHSGPYAGFNYGHFCSHGRMHKFIDVPRRQTTSLNYDGINVTYYHSSFEIPVQLGTTIIFSATLYGGTDELASAPSLTGVYHETEVVSDYTDPTDLVLASEDDGAVAGEDWLVNPGPDEDWEVDSGDEDWEDGGYVYFRCGMGGEVGYVIYTLMPVPMQIASIDSWIRIGLLRIVDQIVNDRLTQFNSILLGVATSAGFTYLDYEDTDEFDEDWETITDAEDWGNGVVTEGQFDFYFTGTVDGQDQLEDNGVSTVDSTIDILNRTSNSILYGFTCTGLWSYFELRAQEVDYSFHLKTAEAEGILAGRLI